MHDPKLAKEALAELPPDIADSPLFNGDLAPVPTRAAQLDDLQLRGAVDLHGPLHPDVHAGRRPDRGRHELVAGAAHHRPRQHHRAGARSCSTRTRARSTASRSRCSRASSFGTVGRQRPRGAARDRRVRLVRHPDLHRRRGGEDLHRGASGRASRTLGGGATLAGPHRSRARSPSCSSGRSTSSSSTAA